jgi:hypothetical protein
MIDQNTTNHQTDAEAWLEHQQSCACWECRQAYNNLDPDNDYDLDRG